MAKKVRRVCTACATLAGKKENQLDSKARFYKSKCDFCEQIRAVCDTNWWGYFTLAQIEQGRDAVRKLGIHRSQNALPEDVQRLIDVVRGVLSDEFMSLETKTIVGEIEARLSKGDPIQMYDTRLLSASYAADCAQMKRNRQVKELSKNDSGIIRPSPELIVVEGGRGRSIRLQS